MRENDDMKMIDSIRRRLEVLILLVALPLLGVVMHGGGVSQYLEFPPLTRYVEHAGFLWPVFLVGCLAVIAVVFPFEFRVLKWRKSIRNGHSSVCAFPWWGWLGLLLTIVTWVLAWNRYSWFAKWQVFTFTPLWIGYIVVVNALKFKRTGKCMMTDGSRKFLLLFVVSAFFWWFFEYLNRFVQNWYYVGIESFTGFKYFLNASVSFSTVLPAVLGTYELLDSFPKVGAGLDHFIRVDIGHSKLAGWLVFIGSSVGLALIGLFPDSLFPLLWVSPLLIVTSLQAIRGQKTIFAETMTGDWRRLYILGVSALLCGFFWEMWNYHSLAQWIYAVPFVGRFKCFEMPVLGYMGYVPFGLECWVVAELFGAGRKKGEKSEKQT
jgi:hypothetical protein